MDKNKEEKINNVNESWEQQQAWVKQHWQITRNKWSEIDWAWSLTLALRATDGGNRKYNCRWNETLATALDDDNDGIWLQMSTKW